MSLRISFVLLVYTFWVKADSPTTATVTRKVYFDIAIGGQLAGRIVLGLFGNTAPKTVTNFVSLTGNEVCQIILKFLLFLRNPSCSSIFCA